MAGMFYSLQEVMSKLNKTKEEVINLVETGKLRKFQAGTEPMFKIDEVEALMNTEGGTEAEAGAVEPTEESLVDLGEDTAVSPVVEAEVVKEPMEEAVTEPAEELGSGEIEALIEESSAEPEGSGLELEPSLEEDISLAPEQMGDSEAEISLGNGDTSIASEGISVLGKTDDGRDKGTGQ